MVIRQGEGNEEQATSHIATQLPCALLLVACCLFLVACNGSSNAPAATARPSGSPASPTPAGLFATIDPRMGPPGTQIVFGGSGWPAGNSIVVTGETAPGQTAAPFATVTVDRTGSI